jgi:hypothetical protein
MSRPTALTPDVQGRVVDAIRGGVTLKEAAAYAGVTDRTILNWMRRGEEAAQGLEAADELAVAGECRDRPDREFVQFFRSVSAARAEVYLDAVATIQLAIRGTPTRNETGEVVGWQRFPDWRAAAWFLEHGDPTQWGRAARTALDQAAEETPSPDEDIDARVARLYQLVDQLAEQRKLRRAAEPRRREYEGPANTTPVADS